MTYIRKIMNTLIALLSISIASSLLFLSLISDISASNMISELETKLLFDTGKFLEAGEAYVDINKKAIKEEDKGYASKMLTGSAWSYSLHGKHHSNDPKKYYKIALGYANKAIEYDANNSDAYVQKGIALTFLNQGDLLGMMFYGVEIREAFEQSIKLDKKNIDGHLSLAAWHSSLASYISNNWLYLRLQGEDKVQQYRENALKHYNKAIEIAPSLNYVQLEYGRGLLLLLNVYELNKEFIGCSADDLSMRRAMAFLEYASEYKSLNELDRIRQIDAKEWLKTIENDYIACITE